MEGRQGRLQLRLDCTQADGSGGHSTASSPGPTSWSPPSQTLPLHRLQAASPPPALLLPSSPLQQQQVRLCGSALVCIQLGSRRREQRLVPTA